MGPVEGIGVGSVGERIAEAMQGEPGSLGPDEVVDRIAVVAGDRGSGGCKPVIATPLASPLILVIS